MNATLKFISVCFLVLVSSLVFSQEKMEKESRLDIENVPNEALEFVQSLEVKCKVKWYLEEGLDGSSIEAKFKKDKKKYSVEFEPTGVLEDVEIEIKWKELSKELQGAIQKQLELDCIKHKINKIQIQYSGTTAAVKEKALTNRSTDNLVTRYELVIKCKDENGKELIEYLFDDKGNKISTTKIVFKASSNLEY